MRPLLQLFLFSLLISSPAWAAKKVAVVKLLKGEVDVMTIGKTTKLKVDDWVEDGSVVKTGEKSFVRLIFVDKSQMNIGPSSEMKIEKFSDKDSGVIDLVKGKIRSQVTKDYLQMDKSKSKLFIKTPNAVMGVRGTDFMISTNGRTTSTILFEGAIVFNRLDRRGTLSSSALEDIVDRGVSIRPGEFSVADRIHPLPTVPAVLNVNQFEALEKNANFDSDRTPGNSSGQPVDKSIVPPGLSGESVSNSAGTLKTEVKIAEAREKSPEAAQGYIEGDKIKPTNGAYLHVDSGVIIAPPPGSVYDPNTNTYIPSGTVGTVSGSGEFVPPKNVEITGDGKVLVATTDPVSGKTVVTQAPPPSPVTTTTVVISKTAPTTVFAPVRSPTTTILAPPPVLNPYDPTVVQSQNDTKFQNQTEQKKTSTVTIQTGQ